MDKAASEAQYRTPETPGGLDAQVGMGVSGGSGKSASASMCSGPAPARIQRQRHQAARTDGTAAILDAIRLQTGLESAPHRLVKVDLEAAVRNVLSWSGEPEGCMSAVDQRK